MSANGGAAGSGDGSTFSPRCVLVTGGAGFIASHVVTLLVNRYPHMRVIALDKLDYCASLRNLSAVAGRPNFKFVKGDICSGDLVSYVLETERCDAVMHFAAQTHVDNSFGNSLAFTLNNTYGTHVVLEACRAASFGGGSGGCGGSAAGAASSPPTTTSAGAGVAGRIKRVINVSTDEVYGDGSFGIPEGGSGLDEKASLAPTNPYSAAKAGAEMVARAYATSYGLPVITTRGNNVYGPHQFPEKLVPKFTLLASRGAPLPVHGDGGATRSYLYVEDVAEAFDVILRKGVPGETYNIGSQRERTVLDVARDITRLFEEKRRLREEKQEEKGEEDEDNKNGGPCSSSLPPCASSPIKHVRDRAFNDRRYFICDRKLAALGWSETTKWEDGLRKTVDWYLEKGGRGYWDDADVEAALAPHPVLRAHGFGAVGAGNSAAAGGGAGGSDDGGGALFVGSTLVAASSGAQAPRRGRGSSRGGSEDG